MSGFAFFSKFFSFFQEGPSFASKYMLVAARLCLLSVYLTDSIRGMSRLHTASLYPQGWNHFNSNNIMFINIACIVPAYLILLHNERFGKKCCIVLMASQLATILLHNRWTWSAFTVSLGNCGCICLLWMEHEVTRERRRKMLSGLPDADLKANTLDLMILIARVTVAALYGLFTHLILSFIHTVVYYVGLLPMAASLILLIIGYKIKYIALLSAGTVMACCGYICVVYGSSLKLLELLHLITSMSSVAGGLMILSYMGAGRLALDHIKKSQ